MHFTTSSFLISLSLSSFICLSPFLFLFSLLLLLLFSFCLPHSACSQKACPENTPTVSSFAPMVSTAIFFMLICTFHGFSGFLAFFSPTCNSHSVPIQFWWEIFPSFSVSVITSQMLFIHDVYTGTATINTINLTINKYLNVMIIFILREDPHLHPQQIWVPVCEKTSQNDPVPSGGEDPQWCPLCPLCQPPRQCRDAGDCTWWQTEHPLLALLGQDGWAPGQRTHTRHPVVGWVPQLLDQLERGCGTGMETRGFRKKKIEKNIRSSAVQIM